VLIVESAGANIHWMEPRDLDLAKLPLTFNPKDGFGISSDHLKLARWGRQVSAGANAVMGDYSVHWLPNEISSAELESLLTGSKK